MTKRLLSTLIGLSLAGTLQAQDSLITLRRPYRTVLKLAPLSLLDQDATVQAGLEYRTGTRTSVQTEVGYGWRGLSIPTSDLDDFAKAEVWRLRSEARFYTGRYRTNRRKNIRWTSAYPLGNYWAIEGLYKQINVVKQDNLYNAERQLTGTSFRPISRYGLGSHLKIGRQFSVYDPHRRVFSRTVFDIFVGAGLRWAQNVVPPAPFNPFPTCGCVLSGPDFGLGRSFTRAGHQWLPSVTAGVKMGFAL